MCSKRNVLIEQRKDWWNDHAFKDPRRDQGEEAQCWSNTQVLEVFNGWCKCKIDDLTHMHQLMRSVAQTWKNKVVMIEDCPLENACYIYLQERTSLSNEDSSDHIFKEMERCLMQRRDIMIKKTQEQVIKTPMRWEGINARRDIMIEMIQEQSIDPEHEDFKI